VVPSRYARWCERWEKRFSHLLDWTLWTWWTEPVRDPLSQCQSGDWRSQWVLIPMVGVLFGHRSGWSSGLLQLIVELFGQFCES
jgi:hypothetical protein